MGHRINTNVTKTTIGFKQDENRLDSEDFLSTLQFFPVYSSLFKNAHSHLLSENGPLPVFHRHFIAIMAARATGCASLVKMEESVFLSSGGNAEWLKDKTCVPNKLRRLDEINKLLAQSPSLITTNHIKILTDGDESWTLTETVQGLVVLIHFHGLSSFLMSSGMEDPVQCMDSIQRKPERKSIEFLDIFDKSLDRKLWKHVQKELKRKRSFSEGEITKNYQTKNVSHTSKRLLRPYISKTTCDIHGHLNKYNEPSNNIRIQDYCWDDQGFSVLSTFYTDIAMLFDDKFRSSKSLISKSEQNKKFVTAIWNFVQCIFGVHHDDYNYKEIDQVLDQNMKDFITSCCNKPSVSTQSIHKMGSKLQLMEKVHVSILVMEARLQSEMLFALKAVMKHMS
eukprot:GFUD01002823.1.p1 GENE.GFUD01002823.1~~GFUD01002823.1.p1  ORF type:complete len:395 (+),score=49.65 GFUD01002823.1:48-1232(+)